MSVAEDELALFERQPKLPWAERARLVRGRFPSIEQLDRHVVLREDWELFARVMGDILKVGQAPPKSGPRLLDYEQGRHELGRLLGNDYTILPFAEAFRLLAGDRSRSHLARKTSLERTKVHRLLRGETAPSIDEIEAVAAAFGKHPSFFPEWRVAYVTAAIAERLEDAPESSINLYRKIERDDGRC